MLDYNRYQQLDSEVIEEFLHNCVKDYDFNDFTFDDDFFSSLRYDQDLLLSITLTLTKNIEDSLSNIILINTIIYDRYVLPRNYIIIEKLKEYFLNNIFQSDDANIMFKFIGNIVTYCCYYGSCLDLNLVNILLERYRNDDFMSYVLMIDRFIYILYDDETDISNEIQERLITRLQEEFENVDYLKYICYVVSKYNVDELLQHWELTINTYYCLPDEQTLGEILEIVDYIREINDYL